MTTTEVTEVARCIIPTTFMNDGTEKVVRKFQVSHRLTSTPYNEVGNSPFIDEANVKLLSPQAERFVRLLYVIDGVIGVNMQAYMLTVTISDSHSWDALTMDTVIMALLDHLGWDDHDNVTIEHRQVGLERALA